ncbi:MAG: cation diffusion facilitator family transporter [Planctomycetota bacterium]
MTAGAEHQAPTDAAEVGGREKRRVALTSIAAAVLLTGLKLLVGLLTGSLGLLAEAAHSGLDLVAAVITFAAVRVSDRPADAEHLYGHAKFENLSALFETLLLLATCAWIIYEGIHRLAGPVVEVDANIWAFLAIGTSILIDVGRSRALLRVARKYNSQALEADALHFSTDVWSSTVVLIGLVLVRIGDWVGGGTSDLPLAPLAPARALMQRADAVAALVVALIVIWVSLRLGRRTVDVLLDRAPVGLQARIDAAVREVPGVLDCRQVRLRQAGQRTFADLEIDVARGLSLETSHEIGSRVEERLRGLLPEIDVVVHVNPVRSAGETLHTRIHAIAANVGQTVHNVLVCGEGDRLYLDLHVEEDPQADLRDAHARVDALEDVIRRDLPQVARITTHIEPHRAPRVLRDVTAESPALVERVRRVAAQTPGIITCREVTVRRDERGVFLALDCVFAEGLAVAEVHRISEDLETRLRVAVPRLVRITTHPEPPEL